MAAVVGRVPHRLELLRLHPINVRFRRLTRLLARRHLKDSALRQPKCSVPLIQTNESTDRVGRFNWHFLRKIIQSVDLRGSMAARGVQPVFGTTTPIRYVGEDGGGTGFFFNHDEAGTFIVTNRHVVDPDDDDINPTDVFIWLRDATNVGQANRVEIPIHSDGSPNWLEHPTQPESVDLALIPIHPELSSLDDAYDDDGQPTSGSLAFTEDYFIHEGITADQRVSIIGYPGNFMDRSTIFPIRRNALIASPYGHNFEHMPIFLTDARMHPGTSGSPVVMEAGGMVRMSRDVPSERQKPLFLLGIHSATFYGTDLERYLNQNPETVGEEDEYDARLDLNLAWYPQLITDILSWID